MYDFAFYFFYGILIKRNDDTIFTSILGVFVIVGFHLLTVIKLLDHFGILSYPTFSSTYLYNKLYWYIPCALLLVIVFLYFNKARTKKLIEMYSAKDNFYSIGNIFLFVLFVILPVLAIISIS